MAQKMKEYISSQPEVWRTACRELPDVVCGAARAMLEKKPRRIVLIGSGSSHYAAEAAACLLERADGMAYHTTVPTRMRPWMDGREETLYWAVSQSGKSTSTEQAVSRLLRLGARVWSITSDEASPLARLGEGHICIPCGEEGVGPKTKGMTATVQTLYLLGIAMNNSASREETELAACALLPAFDMAEENIRLCGQWAEQCGEAFAAASSVTVVAEGSALPLAGEGALKLLETLYVPAQAWEFEEYLHGVNNIIGEGQLHLFLLRSGENRARMERLTGYCEERGVRCFTIDCTGEDVPGVSPSRVTLRVQGREETLPYEAILPFQMLSACVSERKGINCDKPRYPDFYAALGTKEGAR